MQFNMIVALLAIGAPLAYTSPIGKMTAKSMILVLTLAM